MTELGHKLQQIDDALGELDRLAKQVAAGMVTEERAAQLASQVCCRFGVVPVRKMIDWYQAQLTHERAEYARAIATYDPSGHNQRNRQR